MKRMSLKVTSIKVRHGLQKKTSKYKITLGAKNFFFFALL